MKSFTSSNQDLFKDALINSISDSIIATDLHGKIIYWNKAAEEIYKWKSKEVIGKSILEITSSTTTQKQAEEIMNSLKNGKSWEGEFEVQDKNGKIFPVHVKDSPLLDSTGNLIGIIGISRDITDRKKAEIELHAAEEELRNTFNLSPSIICTADLKSGFFLKVNQAVTRILGYTQKEFLSIPIMELIHPKDRQKTADEISEKLKGGKTIAFENRYQTKDDNYKWISWQTSLANEDGIATATGSDIDERKKAEKEAYEKEIRFRELFNNVNDAIFLFDPDNYEILEANEATSELYGYSHEELIGMSCLKFSAEVDKSKAVANSIRNHKKLKVNLRHHKKKDGSDIFVELSTYNISVGGKNVFYSVCHDITDFNKKVRELVKAKQKAEESEEKLSLIVNESPFPVVLADINDENIIYWSESAKGLTGYAPNTVSEWYKLAYPDEEYRKQVFERWKPFLEKARESNEAINTGEYRITCKNGSIKDVVLYAQFIPGNLVVTINDITEQRKVEKALKEQHQYLKKLNNSLGSVVFTVDIDNRKIEYVNNRVKAVFGYNPDECIGHSTRFLYPNKEAFLDYGKQMQKAIQNNQEFLRIENTLRRKNGELFATDITTSFLSKKKVVAVITDITDRKKAEQELIEAKEKAEESEKKFRNAFENAGIGMCLVSLEGKFLQINKALSDILGYSENEILNTTFQEITHPDDLALDLNLLKETIKGKRDHYSLGKRYFNKMGDIVHAKLNVAVIRNIKKEPLFLVSQIQDITKQREYENDLIIAKERAEKSEMLMNKLVANIGDVIVIIDSQGKNRYKSPNVEKLFGWKTNELVGNGAFDNVHPDDIEHARIFIDSLLSKPNKTGSTEVRYRHKNGNYVWIKFTGSNLLHDPIINGILGNYHDISESRNAKEELLKAKDKAEESDRLKSAFLANMSHEIRTPMNGILGFTNLLQEHNLTGEEQNQYIEIIQKSGYRMLDTVNDIIEISKIDTGQVKVSNTKVNISKHLKSLHEFFTLEANKKGLELILDNKLSDDESLIISDKSKLSSILTNLIKNAIKFTEKGTIKISCKKNKKFLELYIEDSGIGIPANRKDAIFNRFEQADIEDKQVYEGSGLGLAITKLYIEMLGGKIWVESEENKGSTFFFTTPYNPAKTEIITKSSGEKQAESKVKKLNILIVEDDETSSLLLSTILNDKAKNIQIVSDGIKAVEICKKNSNFDLILMDVKLPGIDGLEATKRIRKFNQWVKIIAQTAHALEGDNKKAIKVGCNDYISKPIKRNELLRKIDKMKFN